MLIYDIYPENIKKSLRELLLFAAGGLNNYPEWAQKKILKEFSPNEVIQTAAQMILDPSVPSGIKYNIFFFCLYNYGLGQNADNVKELIYAAANFDWDSTLIPTNFKRHLKDEIIPTYMKYYEQKEQELLLNRSKHITYEIEE
ncbi:MAG: hypothetical protein RMJ51_02805 [Candidatus Calescibacterium sp.]|nr:hypothetical protein [Candidatus Calescibacterium sp.]MCX7972243.1 hypothetical protein [bacterium]MDW8195156.1 hypothetical protein [Candidatus Calescibacterium sp.]